MIFITGDDVQFECLADQICSGIKSGIEGSIHAFRSLYEELSIEDYGLLLIDASNAFNSISRAAAIWNTRIYWSRCSRYAFISYRGYAVLFITGSQVTLLSKEGVTQGDPLAMLVYGIGILPLTRKLKAPEKWKQNWYADDSACLAKLLLLKEWLAALMEEGPKFGYYAEPDKSYLVVHPDYIEPTQEIFKDFKINLVTGRKFLGGFIGSADDVAEWFEQKVEGWVKSVIKISNAASTNPHTAYTAFTKSLQCEWIFLQRVMIDAGSFYSPIKLAIIDHFLPSLFGSTIDEDEVDLLCRPVRFAGIGIHDPIKSASNQFNISYEATQHLSESIQTGQVLNLNLHEASIQNALQKKRDIEKGWEQDTFSLLDRFSDKKKTMYFKKNEQLLLRLAFCCSFRRKSF